MTLTPIPPLDEQVTAILMRNGLFTALPAAASTAQEVLLAVERERGRPCTDDDCAARRPHSRLGPHAWRHEACPPFSRVPFTGLWLCFSCGHRKNHRIHRMRPVTEDVPGSRPAGQGLQASPRAARPGGLYHRALRYRSGLDLPGPDTRR